MTRHDIEVYECSVNDMEALTCLGEEFIKESKWGFTFDKEVCQNQMMGYMLSDSAAIIAVKVDGILAGGAILMAQQDLCLEKLGYIHKFYISPTYRRTLAARSLTRKCTEWFDLQDCFISFTTATGHVDQASICAYTNLMSKYDYSLCGPTLCRYHKDIANE